MLNMIPLPSGSLLNGGLYQIERVVNIDGLCITYLASQTAFGDEVLLKEYCYPEEGDERLVDRREKVGNCLDELWANIFMEQIVLEAHQEHHLTGIVKPFEYFYEKNNEYLALENVIGEPLDRHLRRLPNGRMNPAEAAQLIRQIAQTLDCLYNKRAGFVPLYVLFRFNIKPSNILRRSADGEPVLLHFGSDPPFDGYAAPEQFAPFGEQTAATHVYDLGAVFYRMLTGCDPPDCRARAKVPLLPAEQLNGNVPEDLSRIASKAMELDPKKRFANVGELANALVMG